MVDLRAENLRKDLAYLTENSLLHYHPHPPSSFLSLFVRFRPMIAEGTLLRYTDRPRGYAPPTKLPSNIIVGTEATKPARPSDSFILVSLATSGHLIVEASLNKSDLVTMEAGKIRVSGWMCVSRKKLGSSRFCFCSVWNDTSGQ